MVFKLTNEPVRGLEKVFSVDGSGSPTSVKQNYAQDRERQRQGKSTQPNSKSNSTQALVTSFAAFSTFLTSFRISAAVFETASSIIWRMSTGSRAGGGTGGGQVVAYTSSSGHGLVQLLFYNVVLLTDVEPLRIGRPCVTINFYACANYGWYPP